MSRVQNRPTFAGYAFVCVSQGLVLLRQRTQGYPCHKKKCKINQFKSTYHNHKFACIVGNPNYIQDKSVQFKSTYHNHKSSCIVGDPDRIQDKPIQEYLSQS
eukprot:TRINITY_DN34836_c0_g2_i1.p1 TRINITY_DN34836_c0_g2~~TRINITY_DN34836_c0_g2_i1.p1  ORF type:complete len:102 (+),score=1.40 TRINITY_DN34836_c0_g2_i1:136-441(+)